LAIEKIRSGIPQVGGQLVRNVYEPPHHEGRKPDGAKLHAGEIVQGTILDIISSSEALVKLPIGNLRASLQGTLAKGDSLFFKVLEIQPSLVLKIFAVPISIEGKELASKEILRILNLPNINFYRELIAFLRNYQTTISANELLILYNSFSNIKSVDLGNINFNLLFRVLYFIHGLSIPFSENLFKKLLPTFRDSKAYSDMLNMLENEIDSLPKSFQDRLNNYFSAIKNRNLAVIINSFSVKYTLRDDTFLKLLKDLSENIQNSDNASLNELQSNIKSLLNLFESSILYNSIASQNNLPFIFYLPIFLAGFMKLIQIKIKKLASGSEKSKSVIKFSFSLEFENLGNIDVSGTIFDRRIDLILFLEKSESKEIIEKELNNLKYNLIKNNYIIGAIHFSDMKDSEDRDILNQLPQASQQNFTVVV